MYKRDELFERDVRAYLTDSLLQNRDFKKIVEIFNRYCDQPEYIVKEKPIIKKQVIFKDRVVLRGIPSDYQGLENNVSDIAIDDSFYKLSLAEIEDVVCSYLGEKPHELASRSRKTNLVTARHYIFYLTKKFTKISLKTMAERYGGRDHTTALHGVVTIKELLYADEPTQFDIQNLENIIVNLIILSKKSLVSSDLKHTLAETAA